MVTLSKKDIIAYAADLTVKAINVHYPTPPKKTRYVITLLQFQKLTEELYKQNIGRTEINPIELMF